MANNISTKYEPVEARLINAYTKLNNKVYTGIKKANAKNSDELLVILGALLVAEFSKLRQANKQFLEVLNKDSRQVSKQYHVRTNKQHIKELQSQTYIDLQSNLTHAEKELMHTLKETIKPYKETPTHITTVKKQLLTEFVKNNGVTVTYKNGAKVRADKYVEMVTRSARAETHNNTAIDAAIKLGTDYVYLPPRNTSCKTCAALSGRVYCISGKDPNYPKVYGALFKSNYHTIHPHCKCGLQPWFPEHYNKVEIEQFNQDSNRPMELDKRTEQWRQQYQESQDYNRKRWSEVLEYDETKKLLGNELPSELNTLGKFRTAKTKDTPRYSEVRKSVKSLEKIADSKPINIAELKSDIYNKLPYNIKSNKVIITSKQFDRHIAPGANTHNDVWLKVKDRLPSIINSPDYIFKDKAKPNTLLVVKAADKANVVLKLSIVSSKLSNSIITIIPCGNKTLGKMLRTNKILYKKD